MKKKMNLVALSEEQMKAVAGGLLRSPAPSAACGCMCWSGGDPENTDKSSTKSSFRIRSR